MVKSVRLITERSRVQISPLQLFAAIVKAASFIADLKLAPVAIFKVCGE